MNRHLALASLAALALTACGQDQPAPSDTASPAPPPAATPAPTATPTPEETPGVADLVPEAEKGEKGARNVLLAWASALENQRFGDAYALFGHGGVTSGMSAAEYAAQFGRCRKITVAMPTGQMEGAAGSLYYTAPTTLSCELVTGNVEKWTGDVVLRRVNDVDGATQEQLRWHIESADLKPSRE